MSEIKLLPCPFCGGEASLKRDQKDDFVEYSVGCYNRGCVCAAHTYCYYDKEEAIRDWNTRKPMERILTRLEELNERAITGDCISDLRNDKKCFEECEACYMNIAIEIVKEEGGIE